MEKFSRAVVHILEDASSFCQSSMKHTSQTNDSVCFESLLTSSMFGCYNLAIGVIGQARRFMFCGVRKLACVRLGQAPNQSGQAIVYITNWSLRGRVEFPIGGIARER
jgi:hypothetical protein